MAYTSLCPFSLCGSGLPFREWEQMQGWGLRCSQLTVYWVTPLWRPLLGPGLPAPCLQAVPAPLQSTDIPRGPSFPPSFAYETSNLSRWQSVTPWEPQASLDTAILRLHSPSPVTSDAQWGGRGVLLTSLVDSKEAPEDVIGYGSGSCSLDPL